MDYWNKWYSFRLDSTKCLINILNKYIYQKMKYIKLYETTEAMMADLGNLVKPYVVMAKDNVGEVIYEPIPEPEPPTPSDSVKYGSITVERLGNDNYITAQDFHVGDLVMFTLRAESIDRLLGINADITGDSTLRTLLSIKDFNSEGEPSSSGVPDGQQNYQYSSGFYDNEFNNEDISYYIFEVTAVNTSDGTIKLAHYKTGLTIAGIEQNGEYLVQTIDGTVSDRTDEWEVQYSGSYDNYIMGLSNMGTPSSSGGMGSYRGWNDNYQHRNYIALWSTIEGDSGDQLACFKITNIGSQAVDYSVYDFSDKFFDKPSRPIYTSIINVYNGDFSYDSEEDVYYKEFEIEDYDNEMSSVEFVDDNGNSVGTITESYPDNYKLYTVRYTKPQTDCTYYFNVTYTETSEYAETTGTLRQFENYVEKINPMDLGQFNESVLYNDSRLDSNNYADIQINMFNIDSEYQGAALSNFRIETSYPDSSNSVSYNDQTGILTVHLKKNPDYCYIYCDFSKEGYYSENISLGNIIFNYQIESLNDLFPNVTFVEGSNRLNIDVNEHPQEQQVTLPFCPELAEEGTGSVSVRSVDGVYSNVSGDTSNIYFTTTDYYPSNDYLEIYIYDSMIVKQSNYIINIYYGDFSN